jgi:hypothetical protein
LEQKLPTSSEALQQTFGKVPRSLIALETGTHSPWVSRLLTELGHEVIVAHSQTVQWITSFRLLLGPLLARAQGIAKVKAAGIERENLYRALSARQPAPVHGQSPSQSP